MLLPPHVPVTMDRFEHPELAVELPACFPKTGGTVVGRSASLQFCELFSDSADGFGRDLSGLQVPDRALEEGGKSSPTRFLERTTRSLAADQVACVLDVSAHGGFGALPPKLGEEQVYLPAVRDGIRRTSARSSAISCRRAVSSDPRL